MVGGGGGKLRKAVIAAKDNPAPEKSSAPQSNGQDELVARFETVAVPTDTARHLPGTVANAGQLDNKPETKVLLGGRDQGFVVNNTKREDATKPVPVAFDLPDELVAVLRGKSMVVSGEFAADLSSDALCAGLELSRMEHGTAVSGNRRALVVGRNDIYERAAPQCHDRGGNTSGGCQYRFRLGHHAARLSTSIG